MTRFFSLYLYLTIVILLGSLIGCAPLPFRATTPQSMQEEPEQQEQLSREKRVYEISRKISKEASEEIPLPAVAPASDWTMDEEEIPVGLLLPLSGRYADLGQGLLHAAQQALAAYPNLPMALVVGDTGGDVAKTVQTMERFLQSTPPLRAIIGPLLHATARAAIPLAEQEGIPMIVLNPHADLASGRQGVYLNAFHPSQQADAMAQYAVRRAGFNRIALLAQDSDYGKVITKAFERSVAELGGTTLAPRYFPEKTQDFSVQIQELAHMDRQTARERIQRAKQAVLLDPADLLPPRSLRDLEPWIDFDAIFLPIEAKQARILAPQLAFFGLRNNRLTLLGNALWNDSSTLLEEGTDYLLNAVFCDIDPAAKRRFSESYRAHWGGPPHAVAPLVYDSVLAVAEIIQAQEAEEAEEAEEPTIRQITRSEGFLGATGKFRFTEDGLSQHDYRLFVITREGRQPL